MQKVHCVGISVGVGVGVSVGVGVKGSVRVSVGVGVVTAVLSVVNSRLQLRCGKLHMYCFGVGVSDIVGFRRWRRHRRQFRSLVWRQRRL